jgi:7-keto-8-aminopelargonate synthetase-like enzyme
VPEGTSRIRLSVCAHHRPEEIDRLVDTLVAAL